MHVILSVLLIGLAGAAPTEPSASKLICVEDGQNSRYEPGGVPILMRSTTSLRRIDSTHVYSDGSVLLRIQVVRVGLVDCHSKLTAQRLATLRSELQKANVCRASGPKRVDDEKREHVLLDLGPGMRCEFEMTPARWSRSPGATAVDAAMARLKTDVCRGKCPEPKESGPGDTTSDDGEIDTVSPEFRRQLKDPAAGKSPTRTPPAGDPSSPPPPRESKKP